VTNFSTNPERARQKVIGKYLNKQKTGVQKNRISRIKLTKTRTAPGNSGTLSSVYQMMTKALKVEFKIPQKTRKISWINKVLPRCYICFSLINQRNWLRH